MSSCHARYTKLTHGQNITSGINLETEKIVRSTKTDMA